MYGTLRSFVYQKKNNFLIIGLFYYQILFCSARFHTRADLDLRTCIHVILIIYVYVDK